MLFFMPKNDKIDRLVLADTKITGDLENLARMWLVELDLSGTAISGDLQSIVGDIDRWFLGPNFTDLMFFLFFFK